MGGYAWRARLMAARGSALAGRGGHPVGALARELVVSAKPAEEPERSSMLRVWSLRAQQGLW